MAKKTAAPAKFALLIKMNTAAPNYDITTAQIIAKLTEWDSKYGVKITEASQSLVGVQFTRLPKNLDALAADIYDFCPDTIDQGFDNYPPMLEEDESDFEPGELEEMRKLAEGIDFNDPDYGMQLLKKYLRTEKSIGLWWD
jgi:hypothetical protein